MAWPIPQNKISDCCRAKIAFERKADNFQVCTKCKKQCGVIVTNLPKSK